jgi:tRNA(adenine34) deaminase
MCAGAIVQARMDRVVIAARSPKSGCGGTLLNILQNEQFNHQVELTDGVMAEESIALMQRFFRELRDRNRAEKAQCRMMPPGQDPDLRII